MLKEALDIEEQLVQWRRAIHRRPELGFHVSHTAALVAGALSEMGIDVRTGVGRSGVVGFLGRGSPTIAVRADMDALPIQEENRVDYASQTAGCMHACGHDAHTAIALGVAAVLSRRELPSQVRFVFQPSEERADEEGLSGAARMIADGVLEGVDAVIALHCDGVLEVGHVDVGEGWVQAAVDSFQGWIIGRGGHGAYPHQTVDPIWLTSHVLSGLFAIPSRRIPPLQPCVVSVGVLRAGTADNVIPDRVYLEGTLRSYDGDVRQQLAQEVERAFGLARALGGDYQLAIRTGYPATYNHPAAAAWLRQVAADLLGPEKVTAQQKSMGAEDFGLMTQQVEGAIMRLGVRPPGAPPRPLHTATFDIDEAALPVGVAVLAETAVRFVTGRLTKPA